MNLSRRCFLIGSSAAIAAATLPFAIPLVSKTPSFGFRRYFDIELCDLGKQDAVRVISLWVPDVDHPYGTWQMHSRASWRFTHPKGIVVPGDKPLRLDVEGGGPCMIAMTYDADEDGKIIGYSERHEFPSRGPAEVIPLDASDAD